MMAVKDNIKKFVIDENEALDIFRSIRWACGVYCPLCGSFKINNRGSRGNSRRYTCKECNTSFNDFTATPFEKSKIPFGQVLWILTNIHNKSIKRMAEELQLNRKTVARYHKLIREHLIKNHIDPAFNGKIEYDEIYFNAGDKGVKKNSKNESIEKKK